MGQFYKHKELDVNEEKFNDYFNFNDIHNYELIYITDLLPNVKGESISIIGFKNTELTKKLKKQGFNEITYIDDNISNFKAISKISSSDILLFNDNFEVIDSLSLYNIINKFKKIIISNDYNILISLGLIDNSINKKEIKIDKYGIINNI